MSGTMKRVVSISSVLLLTASLMIGSTLAWTSLNQDTPTVAAAEVNPGGRLRNDFNGDNADIYVENFGEDQIFARIMLKEYLEMGVEAGQVSKENRNAVVVTYADAAKSTISVYDDESTWWTHLYEDEQNIYTDPYWDWEWEGSTIYIPTFNKNMDSLASDINGTFEGKDGTDGVSANDTLDRYSDYRSYEIDEAVTAMTVYDADTNDADEYQIYLDKNDGTPPTESDASHYTLIEETHFARETVSSTVMSMAEWLALPAEEKLGAYWVYDADGWAYWAQPIPPGTSGAEPSTGLLLDAIAPAMDDSYYYAIHVIAQFVTADDIGSETEGDGFYDTSKGPPPSAEALTLLETIGAVTSTQ